MNKFLPYLLLIPLLIRIPFTNRGVDLDLFSKPELWGCLNKRDSMFLSLAGACSLFLFTRTWKYNKPLFCLFLLCLVSVFYGFSGWYPIICVTLGMVWYLFCLESGLDFRNAICVVCLIHLALVFCQYFNFDPIFNLTELSMTKGVMKRLPYEVKNVGFFSNLNFTSMFIAVCFPAFLRKRWVYLLPVVITGFIITKTTGSILAIVVACVVAVLMSQIKLLYKGVLVAGLFILLFSYSFIDKPDFTRVDDWKIFSKIEKVDGKISLNGGPKLIGDGIGSFKASRILYRNVWYTHWHNDFLEGIKELGLLVIPIYCWFFYHILVRFKKNVLPGMAIIIGIVICNSSYPIHNATIAGVLLVWLAMFDRKEYGY